MRFNSKRRRHIQLQLVGFKHPHRCPREEQEKGDRPLNKIFSPYCTSTFLQQPEETTSSEKSICIKIESS